MAEGCGPTRTIKILPYPEIVPKEVKLRVSLVKPAAPLVFNVGRGHLPHALQRKGRRQQRKRVTEGQLPLEDIVVIALRRRKSEPNEPSAPGWICGSPEAF